MNNPQLPDFISQIQSQIQIKLQSKNIKTEQLEKVSVYSFAPEKEKNYDLIYNNIKIGEGTVIIKNNKPFLKILSINK